MTTLTSGTEPRYCRFSPPPADLESLTSIEIAVDRHWKPRDGVKPGQQIREASPPPHRTGRGR